MNEHQRRLALGVAVALACAVVLAGVAFGYASFHAGSAQQSASAAVGTSSVGNATSGLNGTVYLHADGPYADRVAAGVAAGLRGHGVTVERVATLEADHDRPVLAVETTEADLRYDPVTPSGRVTVAFGYAKTGNGTVAAAIRRESAANLSAREPYLASGTVTVEHEATGVYSWPAYRDAVTRAAGETLADRLWSATRPS
ncbi:hypothetical protein GCM10009037_08290 [Halarchaeum grantii]|uniref:Uncharacterized protein n=1 Tax=Halarchaeum grantii TaxID=1193105 RepID=A0A830FAE8_9EURY|nr:hypothetical protein [Halarchaeum grantii]GGL26976.1 hypothetical protein GCM10009037_08290 [Halarchaeum grantii]